MHQPLREYKEFNSASIPLVTSVMWQCGGNEEVCFWSLWNSWASHVRQGNVMTSISIAWSHIINLGLTVTAKQLHVVQQMDLYECATLSNSNFWLGKWFNQVPTKSNQRHPSQCVSPRCGQHRLMQMADLQSKAHHGWIGTYCLQSPPHLTHLLSVFKKNAFITFYRFFQLLRFHHF